MSCDVWRTKVLVRDSSDCRTALAQYRYKPSCFDTRTACAKCGPGPIVGGAWRLSHSGGECIGTRSGHESPSIIGTCVAMVHFSSATSSAHIKMRAPS